MRALGRFGYLKRRAPPASRYLGRLFDVQREAHACEALRRCFCGTRRAGKTDLIGTDLIERAEKFPGTLHVYLTLTKGISCELLEGTLEQLIEEYDLPFRKREKNGRLTFVHSNGSRIWLAGCKDKKEAEKYRGFKFKSAYVDESASFDLLLIEYLVEDVLVPALSDLGGQLTLSGTPGLTRTGYFFEVSTGEGERPKWPSFQFSVEKNPHHPHTAETLEEMRLANGWPANHPKFLREWKGLWVNDSESIVYPFDSTRDAFDGELPDGVWLVVLSIDLGVVDHTTFTITASRSGFGDVYVLRSYGLPDMTTSARAQECYKLKKEWGYHRVVVDCGALGKAIVNDMVRDFGIPAVAAEKRNKASAIRNVQGAMLRGQVKFHVPQCRELVAEMAQLVWNEDRTDHKESCKDDCSDGFLYGFREHPVYDTWEIEPPKPGTPEARDAEMDDYKRQMMRRNEDSGRRRSSLRR